MTHEIAPAEQQSALDVLPPAKTPKPAAVAMLTQHASAMQTAYELAARLVTTELVPARYHGKPDDATAAILYGAELGLNPIQALQNVFSVNGSPAIYARTMAALLKARGYRFRTIEKTSEAVTVAGWEPGRDPDSTAPDETSRWSIADAEQAGYTRNKKYDTEPRAMLYAKALAEVCRHVAPDVLLGISYSLEELQAAIAEPVRPGPAPITLDEIMSPAPPVGDEPPEAVETEQPDSDQGQLPLDEPDQRIPMITRAQLTKLHILLDKHDLGDRASGLAWLSEAVGRSLESSKDLSRDEGTRLIGILENDEA